MRPTNLLPPVPRALSPARSLMARLVGSFLTVSLLTVGFVAVIAFSEARGALRKAVIDRLQAAATEREAELKRVERRRGSFVFLSGISELRNDLGVMKASPRGAPEHESARSRVEALLEASADTVGDVEEMFLLSAPAGR